jgi:Holliday junction resolvase RusA-like endonuclease
MIKSLIFTIPGRPKPQKQTVHGKGFHWNPSKKQEDWVRWHVIQQCPDALKNPIEEAICVKSTFSFNPPKTSKKRTLDMLTGKIKHTKRPDVDNLGYLVVNALKGLVYKDDSQIFRLELLKVYAEKEQTVIMVIPVEEYELSKPVQLKMEI